MNIKVAIKYRLTACNKIKVSKPNDSVRLSFEDALSPNSEYLTNYIIKIKDICGAAFGILSVETPISNRHTYATCVRVHVNDSVGFTTTFFATKNQYRELITLINQERRIEQDYEWSYNQHSS
jgi:hypothetical protein